MESAALGILRYLRDQPPSHYSFEVKSFSSLLNSEVHEYQSDDFQAGGYTWRLTLYPKGDKKANVKDHVSLYLSLENTTNLPQGWQLNVDLKLFVFNQNDGKYLTVQDIGQPIKQFSENETELGISELLELETLKDETKGYLVDDKVVFGVDVFVNQPNPVFLQTGIAKRSVALQDQGFQNGVLRTFRNVEPAHYIFKIQPFSAIQKSEHYESGTFEAGGFKWQLSLYPNGNKARDQISLYLRIVDTETFDRKWEVFASFNFFVYDQIRDRFLTIQDLDGTVRRFNELKKEWGISRLLSFDEFSYAPNGYLSNDSASFGAEVFVIKKEATLLKHTAAGENSYTWIIPKFSTLTDLLYYSEPFTIGGLKWKIKLYPTGTPSYRNKYMSVYLTLDEPEYVPTRDYTAMNVNIRLYDQLKTANIELAADYTFKYSIPTNGFETFTDLSNLSNADKGYRKDDTVILRVYSRWCHRYYSAV